MFTVQAVRIYPTKAQAATLDSWMACARRVWNWGLEHRRKAYRRRGESVTYCRQTAMLTRWRENDARMSAVPLRVQRDAIDRLGKAFAAFFRRVRAGQRAGFPRFKGRGRWRSLCWSEAKRYVDGERVRIPKIGCVRTRNLRPVSGRVKGLRIVKRADRWYAQLLIDDGQPEPAKVPVRSAVGIDLGLASFATLSTGEAIGNPRHFRRLEKKLRRAGRVVSRRKKGSHRRDRAKARLARLHLRIADARSDFTHKLSKAMVGRFDLIAVEKLNVAGLVRGRLGKSITDAAWSQFLWQLTYKAERAGKSVVQVDPCGTSQECSRCGEVVPKPLKERVHSCPGCGLTIDRDHNAAINILERAVAAVGGEITRGETVVPGSAIVAG